ncbi:MAG: hypothetical protein ABSG68_00730 [Thermoguttaceae bacterium]|jgi:hypothetical protein
MTKENGPKPKHAVIVLADDRGNVGHVGVRRLDQPAPWLTVWQHRQEFDTPLARWLRTLDKQPTERVLVGSVGLHGRTARAIVALVAGWFGQEGRLSNVGGRGRPTGRIEPDGSLRCWPSRSAAARDLGVSRWVVRRRVRAGKLLDLG